MRVAARPEELIVATPVLFELHVAPDVTSSVDPSVKLPVTVNCWLFPSATEGAEGPTVIEANAAAVTVSVAGVAVMELKVAPIEQLP